METQYDAVVIGGGPGGSTTAAFLARAGKRVLLLEKERFPRFHIGESLLPYNRAIFEELGVWPMFQEAGFIEKYGAQFHLCNGSKSLNLVFSNGRFTRETRAFQVERSKFDHILLKHARASGADVREGWTVKKTSTSGAGVEVEACGPAGARETFRGAFLVDASGRSNLTGNQEGLRQIHGDLKKVAVFGHFSGVKLDEGEKAGDTIIVRFNNKWFWVIPLASEKVSVGCVCDQEELARSKQTPEQIFEASWQASAPLRERMQNARRLGPLQTTSDFSYHNRRLVGPRLMRVGDAAGFMDPIFSAGVFLAMYSGRLAARLIVESLKAGDDGRRRLKVYEKQVDRAMKLYWNMVRGFYTTPFLEVFMEPRYRLDLPAAVTAVLAGEVNGSLAVRWRVWLFYTITRVQAWLPLLPRISFAEMPNEAGQKRQETAGTLAPH